MRPGPEPVCDVRRNTAHAGPPLGPTGQNVGVISDRRSPVRRAAVAAAAFAVALAACGSDADDATDDPPASETAPADDTDGDGAAPADGPVVIGAAIQETGPVEFEVGTQLVPFVDTAGDPAVGQPSPVVEGQRFDGTDITIGGPTEQDTLYVFLAHWCPHCNDEIPTLIGLDDDGLLPADLNVVGISTAAAEDRQNFPPSEWMVDAAWPWDVMADDENLTAIQVFGGNSFPYAVLVAADGTVLARRAGASSADDLVSWIDAGLAAV